MKSKIKISQRAQQLIDRTAPHQTCLRALLIFAAQNPGFEFGNYGNVSAYRGDARPVARQMQQIKALSWQFSSLSNDIMKEAARRAFSGRLQFVERNGGFTGVDYTTGQYFPTEYRKASLAVLEQALRIANEQFKDAQKARGGQ